MQDHELNFVSAGSMFFPMFWHQTLINACSEKSPKLGWTARPGGLKMWDTVLPDGSIQSFYYLEDHPTMPGWFKGMQAVLEEWGLFWYKENGKGLNGECKDFKCPKGVMECCCRHILFNQPDFVGVKSHLEEVMATYVTFTQNFTASWTTLSNTGV